MVVVVVGGEADADVGEETRKGVWVDDAVVSALRQGEHRTIEGTFINSRPSKTSSACSSTTQRQQECIVVGWTIKNLGLQPRPRTPGFGQFKSNHSASIKHATPP